MSEATGIEVRWLRAAEQLDRARRSLLEPTPEKLAAVERALEAACAEMERLRDSVAEAPPWDAERDGLRQALRQWRRSTALLAALLDSAARFHLGWARMLAVTLGGYDASGQPAPLPRASTVSLEG